MEDQEVIDVCREGDNVIIDVNGDRQSLLKLRKGGTAKIGKAYCSVDVLIGQKYGSLWELDRNILKKRKRVCETAGEDWSDILDINKNNSQLNDGGTANQSLTAADISKLKEEGKSGDEIIAALTQNSATFQNKTQYSQNKYMKKKAKKYLTHATLVRPTARSLTDFYFNKMPQKIGGLRCDTLAILLSLANISAGSRTLIVDNVGGLVTGAALERMGGEGDLVNAYIGDKKVAQEIAGVFNFPDTYTKPWPASLAELRGYLPDEQQNAVYGSGNNLALRESNAGVERTSVPEEAEAETAGPPEEAAAKKQKTSEDGSAASVRPVQLTADPEKASATLNGSHPEQNVKPNAQVSLVVESRGLGEVGTAHRARPVPGSKAETADVTMEEAISNTDEVDKQQQEKVEAERRAKREARKEKLQQLCQQGFQSCILAHTSADPVALLPAVMPLLAPSASFAVFFPAIGPLSECMEAMKATKSAIAMQLQESWWREYQVLPGRTHPTMATSGTGGYILSGTKVLDA